MTISGVLFLLAFLVIGYVLLKFAIKAATTLLACVALFAATCWFFPEVYEASKPTLARLMPFIQDGATEAVSTAKAMTSSVNKESVNPNE